MATTKERRRHARQSITRPCKIQRPALAGVGAFSPARTRDLSESGALLEIESPRPLSLGETVNIGVCWTRSAVMSQAALTPARVVRVQNVGSLLQVVAVQFNRVESAAAVA